MYDISEGCCPWIVPRDKTYELDAPIVRLQYAGDRNPRSTTWEQLATANETYRLHYHDSQSRQVSHSSLIYSINEVTGRHT